MKLTGAAILVSRGMKVLQAAPAAYPYSLGRSSHMTQMRIAPLLPLLIALSSCWNDTTRNDSPLTDNLNGVWVYPKEQPGDTSVTIIKGTRYEIYDHSERGYELSRKGEIFGQEGVYFFPNEADYYSPKFFVEHDGSKFLILNKYDYDKYVRDGRLEIAIWMRVSDNLDFSNPPTRPSIESLGIPYDNTFADEGDDR